MFSRWIITNITSASVTTFLAFLAGIISWSVYCIFQYTRWHSIIINERGSHRAHRSSGRECRGLASAFLFLRTTPTGYTVGLYFNGISSYLTLTLYGLILYLLRATAELSARLMPSVLHDIIIAVVMADLSMRPKVFLFCCCRVRLLIPHPPRFTVLPRTLL
jgi:hypothetical protein